MALPFLDAMAPAVAGAARVRAAATAAQAPTRMAMIYVPNGVIMESWLPEIDGETLHLSPTLSPLERHKDELLVFHGLSQQNGTAGPDGAGDHARASASYLTGVRPKKTAGADIRNGISADQLAAEEAGRYTRLPSLELTLESGRIAGSCDSGYSCAYSNSISWRTEHTPNPPEPNPRAVFERLFGGFDRKASASERAKERRLRHSVLDLVADDAKALMGKLGATDRRKLDEYLYGVRQLERRVESSEFLERLDMSLIPDAPDEKPSDFVEYARLMFDLQVLALQTDQTRVITFMIGGEGSNRRHTEIGVEGEHHGLSHHLNDEQKIEQLAKINKHHVEQFAYFLDRMKATEDGDGSLLDHSMVLYGSGLSDGNRHQHHDLPLLLAGRGNGTLKPGRLLVYEKKTPMNNLLLSMLDRMGIHGEELGDATGKLDGLAGLG